MYKLGDRNDHLLRLKEMDSTREITHNPKVFLNFAIQSVIHKPAALASHGSYTSIHFSYPSPWIGTCMFGEPWVIFLVLKFENYSPEWPKDCPQEIRHALEIKGKPKGFGELLLISTGAVGTWKKKKMKEGRLLKLEEKEVSKGETLSS